VVAEHELGRIGLTIPGEHNVLNGLAALSAARSLKIKDKFSFEALGEYKGVWRRFDIKKTKLEIRHEVTKHTHWDDISLECLKSFILNVYA